MKQILTIVMLLTSLASYSQDTLCVMICLDEILYFDYQTSEIKTRFDHIGSFELPLFCAITLYIASFNISTNSFGLSM